jgi:HK97 family phage prohead protease
MTPEEIRKLKEKIQRANDGRERRKFDADFEIRAASGDTGNMLIGYPARFNVWSDDLGGFRERLKPGAFKKALMISDVRALYNHNSDQLPLGRTPKTLRLLEDTKGLKMENDLPVDPETNKLTGFANDLVIAINRGDITQMSCGFTVNEDGDEWYEKDGIVSRTILEGGIRELFDVSPVVYPAYSVTKVAVRTIERLDEFLKAAGRSGDNSRERAQELELMQMDEFILTI